jgi:hypothetical protein
VARQAQEDTPSSVEVVEPIMLRQWGARQVFQQRLTLSWSGVSKLWPTS